MKTGELAMALLQLPPSLDVKLCTRKAQELQDLTSIDMTGDTRYVTLRDHVINLNPPTFKLGDGEYEVSVRRFVKGLRK